MFARWTDDFDFRSVSGLYTHHCFQMYALLVFPPQPLSSVMYLFGHMY